MTSEHPAAVPTDEAVNIVIVDDRPDGLLTLEAVLRRPGYRLIPASSGPEAIAIMRTHDVAVVVLDVQMPGMDGFETARQIKAMDAHRETPIIFVTAISKDIRNVYQGYSSGAVDYLLKPFDPHILSSKVAIFVELYRKTRAIERQGERLRLVERQERLRELSEVESENVRRYRHLADAIPHLVWNIGEDGTARVFNQAWFDTTGWNEERSQGTGWQSAFELEDLGKLMAIWDAARASRASFETECRIHNDLYGGPRWHLVRAVPFDDRKEGATWLLTATDIHDRKRHDEERAELFHREQAARCRAEEAQDRLAFLAEASTVLAGSLDFETGLRSLARLAVPRIADWCSIRLARPDGRLELLAVFHPDPEKRALAERLDSLYPTDAHADVGPAHVVRTCTPELIAEIDPDMLRRHAKDDRQAELLGQIGFRSSLCVPLKHRDECYGALSFVSDSDRRFGAADVALAEEIARRAATAIENSRLYRKSLETVAQLKERTRALELSNRDLEQFAYVASHDLQEPLRKVVTYVDLLHSRYGDKMGEEARKYISYAVDGVRRMHGLILGLLAYSRVDRQTRPTLVVDCAEIVALAVANLQEAITDADATIVVGDLPRVIGEKTQLTQLFQNLVGNALKFRTDRPPEIRIEARRENGDWLFSVTDNGIGIEAQYGERIFMIFQRLHSQARYPGSGIGLALCKKIVERHEGRIWFESTPGEGSTFYFTLPSVRDAGHPVASNPFLEAPAPHVASVE